MRIARGSDHAGFALKEAVKPFLTAADREVLDLGTHSTDPVDYSDYAEPVRQALRDKRAERGILLCGSGVGASMAANRIPGIRAGLCHDTYSAHQGSARRAKPTVSSDAQAREFRRNRGYPAVMQKHSADFSADYRP